MSPGEALLAAMERAGNPQSSVWDRLAVTPGVGITRAPRVLNAVEKAKLHRLYRTPLVKGRRPKAVEDEIAKLLKIPSRDEIMLMLKRTGIYGY